MIRRGPDRRSERRDGGPAIARDEPAKPGPAHDPARALSGAVRVVFSVTLLSRVGGLARDLMLVYVFGGANSLSSAFHAAFAVPNMFRRLFGEGALSAAFIPEYAQTHKNDPELAHRFATLTLLGLLAATAALTVVVELALLGVLLGAPGDPNRVLSVRLVMVMFPFMPLVCVAAILSGMLQVHGRFGPASAGPILLNGFIIATGVYALASGRAGDELTAYLLGGATVVSGVTQCLWFLRLLRPYVRWTRVFTGAGAGARRMLRRFVPVLVGMGTLQINTFLDTLLAAWPLWVGPMILGLAYPMDERSASILAFTQRLYQFPLGVFGIAVATAVFPLLARHADEPAHFVQTLRRGLRLSLYIGAPASVGLMLVRHDLTATLFSYGQHGFDASSLARAAGVLAGFAPAVWAYSLNHVFARAFYARGDTRTPMRVAVAMVGFNFTLNCALMWPLREAGLAWSTSISAIVQCVLLAWLVRRMLGERVLEPGSLGAVIRILAGTAAMAAVVLLAQFLIGPSASWAATAGRLGAACGVGAAAYVGATVVLRSHELRWLIHRG